MSGTIGFSGPAGSAKFDPVTNARFIEAVGVFADGAGETDALAVGDLRSPKSSFLVKSTTGSVTVSGTTNATLAALDGNVNVNAIGVGKTVTINTTDGEIDIVAQGVNRTLGLWTADGPILLTASGVAKKITASTEDGDIELTAHGAIRRVLLSTNDGDIAVSCEGTDRDVNISTTEGDVYLHAGGTGKGLQVSADDGNIDLTALGFGRSIRAYGVLKSAAASDTATPTPYRVLNALAMSGVAANIAETVETAVLSASLPPGFFGVSGQTVHGTANFTTAANTNSKLFLLYLGATQLFESGGVIDNKLAHLEFEVSRIDTAGTVVWWYRLSVTVAKGNPLIVEDCGATGGITFTNALDLEIRVDGVAANDIGVAGSRMWVLST